MDTEIVLELVKQLAPIIAAIGSIVCGIIASRNGKRAEEVAKQADEYRKNREELDIAKWKVLKATLEGVTILLKHAHGEQLNGNVEEALINIEEAETALDTIQNKLLAAV